MLVLVLFDEEEAVADSVLLPGILLVDDELDGTPISKDGSDLELIYRKFISLFLRISYSVKALGMSDGSLIISLSSPRSGPSLN
jgi:hypothetical protein